MVFQGSKASQENAGEFKLTSIQPRLMFKSCPRCVEGDVYRDRDEYGEYLDCVQCGWMFDLPREDRVQEWRRTAASDGLGLTMSPAS